MAFALVKEMQADGLEWGEGYRPLGREALAEIIQGRMAEAVDYWLASLDDMAMRDRRNGHYTSWLMTGFGDIELGVPRTQPFCQTGVLKSFARRAPEIDRAILAGFVPGLSTRKVSEVLLPLLGRPLPHCLCNDFRFRLVDFRPAIPISLFQARLEAAPARSLRLSSSATVRLHTN